MKRAPFKLDGRHGAQARRPGGRLLSARRSFVWLHGVIVPIACGLEGVEIRKDSNSPWHRITYTPDEAYALLLTHYPMQRGLRRQVEMHRRRRGIA